MAPRRYQQRSAPLKPFAGSAVATGWKDHLMARGRAEVELRNRSLSIEKVRRFATAALAAAGWVVSGPAHPQVSPDLQQTCAQQAETVFREKGYSKDVTRQKGDDSGSNDVIANFESHYNIPLNKCFILLEIFGVGAANAGFQIRSLLDAYEGRTYAEYAWGPAQSKNYWEVRPYCRLMPSDDDQTNCKSEAEFNSFSKNYME